MGHGKNRARLHSWGYGQDNKERAQNTAKVTQIASLNEAHRVPPVAPRTKQRAPQMCEKPGKIVLKCR
jgi:hypothetical protein